MVHFIEPDAGLGEACGLKSVQRVTLLSLGFIDQEVAFFSNADINRYYPNFHLFGQVGETFLIPRFIAVVG